MDYKTYYAKMLSSCSDPQLVANAFEQYYRRVYDRTISKVGYITTDNKTEDTSIYDDDLVTLQINGISYSFGLKELREVFQEKLISELTENEKISIIDNITGENVQLDFMQVSQALGNICDNCYVTWQAYKSIATQSIDKATNFLDSVSIRLDNSVGSLKSTVSGLYEILSDTSSSMLTKINGVCSYTGLVLASTSPDSVETENFELSEYTGVNPVVGWLSGINWRKGMLGVLSIPTMINKFVINCLTTIVKTGLKLISKAFSWIGGWFKRTFVDPVDYKCSDDTLQYFKIPGKFLYRINPSYTSNNIYANGNVYGLSIDKLLFEFFGNEIGDNREIWLNDGCVFIHLQLSVDSSNQYVITEERYMKPIDMDKLQGVLERRMQGITYSHFWPTNDMTAQDLLDLIYDISQADLSLKNKVPEKDVYIGLVLSSILFEIFSGIRGYISSEFYSGITVWDGKNPILNEIDLSRVLSFNDVDGNSSTPGIVPVSRMLYKLSQVLSWILGVQNGSTSIGGVKFSVFGGLQFSPSDINSKKTITNVDFIEMLTSNMRWDPDYEQYTIYTSITNYSSSAKFENSYLLAYASEKYTESSSMFYNVDGSSYYYRPAWLNSILLLYFTRVMHSGDDLDGALVPYVTSQISFQRNVDVVTDAEHIDAISNFVVGAAVAIAVVTATVVGGVVIARTVTALNKYTAISDAVSFSYGDAISKGNIVEANSLYKQYKSANIKRKALSLVLGKSGDAGSNILNELSNSLTPNNNGIPDIIRLIK